MWGEYAHTRVSLSALCMRPISSRTTTSAPVRRQSPPLQAPRDDFNRLSVLLEHIHRPAGQPGEVNFAGVPGVLLRRVQADDGVAVQQSSRVLAAEMNPSRYLLLGLGRPVRRVGRGQELRSVGFDLFDRGRLQVVVACASPLLGDRRAAVVTAIVMRTF